MEGGREGRARSEGDKSKSLQGVLTGVRGGVKVYSSRRGGTLHDNGTLITSQGVTLPAAIRQK